MFFFRTRRLRCDTRDFELQVIANVLRNVADAGWGPNALFRFPKQNGTGGIWKNVSKLLPQEKLKFQHTVVNIDVKNKVLTYGRSAFVQAPAIQKFFSHLDSLESAECLEYRQYSAVGGIAGRTYPVAGSLLIVFTQEVEELDGRRGPLH